MTYGQFIKNYNCTDLTREEIKDMMEKYQSMFKQDKNFNMTVECRLKIGGDE